MSEILQKKTCAANIFLVRVYLYERAYLGINASATYSSKELEPYA